MAEAQPPTIVEGATTGDVEDEIPVAKSAEDRKAQAALSSLDAPREDDSNTKNVDQDAIRKAMDRLAGKGATNGTVARKEVDLEAQATPVRKFKIDPKVLKRAMDETELNKVKATKLLEKYEGEYVKALRAYVRGEAL